jgi:exonuclease SbcC
VRVHRLEVEAFGPFAERVVVDVDALSGEGLFLIHGPTGSGKTSLLDAICFALYADVPGARSKRGLRSDHAEPDAVPRVTLELTVGTRRLRITRSPEFHRPKRRGAGLSKVQPSVTLEEHVEGRWLVRSTRHDEVADVVLDVLGMGMTQFAKVVLLPQGDFAAFLRATPEDRREVLERLFDITAFADVEAWLAEERRGAGADLEQARGDLARLLARLEDVLADAGAGSSRDADEAGVPEVSPLGDLPAESVAARLREVAEQLSARVTSTMAEYDAATSLEHVASEELALARAVEEHRRRGSRALARLADLAEESADHEARVRTLTDAERAAAVGGHVAAHARLLAEEADAADAVERSVAVLAATAPRDTTADLLDTETAGRVTRRVLRLDETVAGIVHELADAEARLRRRADLVTRVRTVTERIDAVTEQVAAAEVEHERLAAEVEVLAEQSARVPELELRAAAARERLTLLTLAEEDESLAASVRPRRNDLREVALDRRSELLDLRQRRLAGMAGELALALVAGDPCPVCGAPDHPEPARVTDPVGADDITSAEERLAEAEEELHAVETELQRLLTRSETRRRTLGPACRADLDADARGLAGQLEAASAAARTHAVSLVELASAAQAVERLRTELDGVLAEATSLTVLLTELTDRDADGARRLASLQERHRECPCSSEDPAEHTRLGEVLVAHGAALATLTAARSRAEEALAELERAVSAVGFPDVESAQAAVRDREECDRLKALVASHHEEVAACRAVVEDPDVVAALALDPPDVPALERAARDAREALLAVRAAQDEAARALRGLERLLPLVEDACRVLAAAASRDARVRDLADTVSGIGPDNTLRMRLTAYVLASRLEKVAALANERLAVLGGGRYVLEHSDERAARGARSGLGLRVLDQWTGRARDTATLSGGESFMASLALALGLADAVREEAGGLDLGTLFIDEGFGSLDDDSLEQVLTVLDGLREGGRAVGVVSHVADLRSRITHQAVVHKGAAGSTVEVRAGGGPAGRAPSSAA